MLVTSNKNTKLNFFKYKINVYSLQEPDIKAYAVLWLSSARSSYEDMIDIAVLLIDRTFM